MTNKDQGALRTIGEVAEQFGLPTHILRYWETRFSALKPLTRAGNRRYYRPEDVVLIDRINRLLNVEGFTIKGAEKALASGMIPGEGQGEMERTAPAAAASVAATSAAATSTGPQSIKADAIGAEKLAELRKIRDRLARALADSQV